MLKIFPPPLGGEEHQPHVQDWDSCLPLPWGIHLTFGLLLPRPPDREDLELSQLFQFTADRTSIDFDEGGLFALSRKRIGRRAFAGRKLEKPLPFQSQHKAPADHVTHLPVGLSPVPGFTDLAGKRLTADGRLGGDEPANEIELRRADLSAAVSNNPSHANKHSKEGEGTQVRGRVFSGFPTELSQPVASCFHSGATLAKSGSPFQSRSCNS